MEGGLHVCLQLMLRNAGCTEPVPIGAFPGRWPGDPHCARSTCLRPTRSVATRSGELLAGTRSTEKRAETYFGRRLGLPPGLPGGGITGILPVSGVGARISGSTPDGGHNTPSDFASLSPTGSRDWPTVESLSALAPSDLIGSQLAGIAAEAERFVAEASRAWVAPALWRYPTLRAAYQQATMSVLSACALN